MLIYNEGALDIKMTVNIEQLTIKEKWKERFKVLYDIEQQQKESIAKGEKVTVSPYGKYFSFLAFIFGPFYYMYHRMFKKAWLILVLSMIASIAYTLVEIALGQSLGFFMPGIFVAIICAMIFNYDYYRKVVHQDDTWPSLKFAMSSSWLCFLYFVISIIVVWFLFEYLDSNGLLIIYY